MFNFGTTATATPAFGAAPAGNLFGAAPASPLGGIGAPATTAITTRGAKFVPPSITVDKDNSLQICNIAHTKPGFCITQIRAADYAAGAGPGVAPVSAPAAAPAAGATTGGLFSAQPAQTNNLFSVGGTGTGSLSAAPNLFSSTPAATGNIFGGTTQTPTTGTTGGLFGGLGQSTTTTTPSLFGTQPQTTTQPAANIFGGTTQTTTQPAASTSLFSFQPQQTTQPSTGGLFGGLTTNTTNTSTSLFGNAQPAATTTPTQNLFAPAQNNSGLFFNTQPQQQTQQTSFLNPAASVAVGAANAKPMPHYGKKLPFDTLVESENQFNASLSKIPSQKDESKSSSSQKQTGLGKNEVLFVANPRFPYTRQLIKAKPRYFNFDSRRDPSKSLQESTSTA